MSNRSNFYKNSAYSYAREFDLNSVLENLHAYRVATGEIAAPSCAAVESTSALSGRGKAPNDYGRRPHKRWKPEADASTKETNRRTSNDHDEESNLTADPHAEYIRKTSLARRPSNVNIGASIQGAKAKAEVTLESKNGASRTYPEVSNDLTKHEVSDVPISFTNDDEPPSDGIIKYSSDQRFAAPGEPTCCRCGKYGEYICDETGDDVCSLDCKNELLQDKASQRLQKASSTSFVAPTPPADALQIPEVEPDIWDYKKHRWTYRQSSLSTFRCWKCKRPGHLPADCTATLGIASQSPTDPTRFEINRRQNESEASELQALYKRCKRLRAAAVNQGCRTCGTRSNLAVCLDCSEYFCDSNGHLTGHLSSNPQHRQIYSFKLERLVKCCKGTCAVTDIKELLTCQHCFSKACDKSYSMYTAAWKVDGLKMVRNAVCCDDHFDWHRMNCPQADVENSGQLVTKEILKHAQFSEFLF